MSRLCSFESLILGPILLKMLYKVAWIVWHLRTSILSEILLERDLKVIGRDSCNEVVIWIRWLFIKPLSWWYTGSHIWLLYLLSARVDQHLNTSLSLCLSILKPILMHMVAITHHTSIWAGWVVSVFKHLLLNHILLHDLVIEFQRLFIYQLVV